MREHSRAQAGAHLCSADPSYLTRTAWSLGAGVRRPLSFFPAPFPALALTLPPLTFPRPFSKAGRGAKPSRETLGAPGRKRGRDVLVVRCGSLRERGGAQVFVVCRFRRLCVCVCARARTRVCV